MSLILDDDYPELLALIARTVYERLTRSLKLEHQPAVEAALDVAEAVRHGLGGASHIYVPKGRAYELSLRDREIYAKFRGDNYDQLARDFGLTEMRIRQIIERCRAADIQARQSGLDF